jgi:hypothetical protein
MKFRNVRNLRAGRSHGKVARNGRLFGETSMPRRSNASLTIASFMPGLKRVEPPPELSEGSVERAIFIETVASVPPEHFAPEDRVLLAEYARTAALARRASEELAISHRRRWVEPVAGGAPRISRRRTVSRRFISGGGIEEAPRPPG